MGLARTDFEDEFEDELEDEMEDEYEDEAFFGGLANIAKSFLGEGEDEYEFEGEMEDELEGEFEDEFEDELEGEFEDEYEDEMEDEYEDEAFLGGLANIAKSFLGEGEDEDEGEYEDEAEQFFGKIGRFLKKHKNVFRMIAKKVGPLVATAVGGPAAGALARAVTSQLEGEFEAEMEAELEEMATAPMSAHQAMGEYLAARASVTESESEAEAFAGSAVTLSLSEGERRSLEDMLPHLVRGASILTRALHRHPASRPGVRLVPGIVDTAARTLARQSGGRPVSRADVGAALGTSARRVLGDWRWQQAVARRHARGLARVYGKRRRLHRHHGHTHPRRRARYGRPTTYRGTRGRRIGIAPTIRRTPARVRTVPTSSRVTRPRPGYVRVVTPVRVPARGGVPAKTMRVVSDVKVPRGAVPAGRSVGIHHRRR